MKYVRLLACAALLTGLAACDSEPSSTDDTAAPGAATTETAPASTNGQSNDPAAGAASGDAAGQQYAAVDAERLRNARNDPAQWMTTGGDYEEQHFSRLDQIDKDSVSDLKLAWYADLDTNLTQEGTPLVIDGVLYATTAWSKVYAIDAKTGEQLWKYDPEVPGERGGLGCCGVVNRGAAAWNGKIYVGTFDGRLVALDAKTGEEVWSVMTVTDEWPYSITGAPRVVKGNVIIGNAGAELGVRGYVTAYDAETGEKAWRFYTVPGNPAEGPDGEISDKPLKEIAEETWTGEWWRLGGGGTVWDAIVYDPETDLVYLGVGNGSPWNASERSPDGGDNLFLSSIVALDPDTGEYVWHFQQVPWETWDYTATAPITITDLEIDGEKRRVLMQMPKNGFFYVLDAKTGEFISAENVVPQNWALSIDPETGRPDVNPEVRYDVTGEPTIVMPGAQAAHSWHPWALNPNLGLVYIPARHTSIPLTSAPDQKIGIFNLGVDWISGSYLYDEPGNEEFPQEITHELVAWDPVKQEARWRTPMMEDGGAGVLATAGGLVFQGSSASEELIAYDAETGERLWGNGVQTGVVAAPVSYAVDGEQYVAVVVGAGGTRSYYDDNHSRVLSFKLNGTAELPDLGPPPPPRQLDPPPLEASAETVKHGEELYASTCAMCHGDEGATRGALFPDLRYSGALWAQEDFDSVVLDGIREQNGMRSFEDELNEEDSRAIRAYLISIANEAKEQQQAMQQN